MLLTPPILALITSSVLACAYTLYASGVGVRILWRWDMRSASESQLALERKTYLISAILSYVLAIELVSLFLYVAVADHLHPFFTGAMCAAGTLNAGTAGLTTLAVKTASFLLCGLWLIVNHVDGLGSDYPLVRFKYAFLLAICLTLLIECALQLRYLSGLDPQIIVSCCGTLFGENRPGIVSEMAHLPAGASAAAFYAAMAFTLSAGARFERTARGGWLYGASSLVVFPLALAALVSCFCLYFYELPTHHCPFCILQREYHGAGYFLYALLLAGTVAGAGVGAIGWFRPKASLAAAIPRVQRRLCRVSMLAYGAFTLWVTYPVVFSDFRLTGY